MVYSENTRLNNQSLLETEYHQYESKYNNKGGLSLIYKINLEELIFTLINIYITSQQYILHWILLEIILIYIGIMILRISLNLEVIFLFLKLQKI